MSNERSDRASLSAGPLSVDAVTAQVAHAGAGGTSLFLGTVRDTNEGHAVTLLEYHAYEALALAEMIRILDEIEAEIPGVRAAVAHRTGALAVGDLAVVAADQNQGATGLRHAIAQGPFVRTRIHRTNDRQHSKTPELRHFIRAPPHLSTPYAAVS